MRHCTILVFIVVFIPYIMVCFVSSRTLMKKHIVTCFFSLRENLCYEKVKTSISMFEILEPGGVSFGPIQHLSVLNSM